VGTDNPFPTPSSRRPKRVSKWADRAFAALTGTGATLLFALLALFVIVLVIGAGPSIRQFGLHYLTNTVWIPASSNPNIPGNIYGIVPFAVGTLLTSALALLIAIPLSLGAAIFLTQQAPRQLRRAVGQLIELLAAIPSIIYGFWGLIVLVPIMRYDIEPGLYSWLWWTGWFNSSPTGLDVLTASVVLAVMVIPTITAISRDSIAAVPIHQKEAALSLGATTWETTRVAMIPYSRSGIVGGVILGLGRAIGETMAVLMVIGNSDKLPLSLIGNGSTISTLIANELLSNTGPLQISAILECGLVLMLISLAVNVGARLLVWRFAGGQGGKAE